MADSTLVPVNDMRTHLNIAGVKNDDDLQQMINAAVKLIEARVGPLDAGSFTTRVYGCGGQTLVLGVPGAVTFTSATLDVGGTYPTTGWVGDPTSGVVSTTGAMPSGWFTLVYTTAAVDPETVPNLVLACKIIVQHMWETRRSNGGRQAQGGAEFVPGASYLIPHRAEALIEPNTLSWGFA